MNLEDALWGKAEWLDQMRARGQVCGLEDVSDILRQASVAINAAKELIRGRASLSEMREWLE